MKAARIIAKNHKKLKPDSSANGIHLSVIKRKTSSKKLAFKSAAKISAQTQFNRIKEALDEIELIEAGKIRPASLKDALTEL